VSILVRLPDYKTDYKCSTLVDDLGIAIVKLDGLGQHTPAGVATAMALQKKLPRGYLPDRREKLVDRTVRRTARSAKAHRLLVALCSHPESLWHK
jgi:hypothetical protein